MTDPTDKDMETAHHFALRFFDPTAAKQQGANLVAIVAETQKLDRLTSEVAAILTSAREEGRGEAAAEQLSLAAIATALQEQKEAVVRRCLKQSRGLTEGEKPQ